MGDLTFAEGCVLTGTQPLDPGSLYGGPILEPSLNPWLPPAPLLPSGKVVFSSTTTIPSLQSSYSLPSQPQPLLTTLPSESPKLPCVLHLGPECIFLCTAVIAQGLVAKSSDWLCDLSQFP